MVFSLYSCGESALHVNLSGVWGIQACFEYPPYAGAATIETATKLAEQKSTGPGSTTSWAWADGSGGVAYKRNGMATEVLDPQELYIKISVQRLLLWELFLSSYHIFLTHVKL